MASENVIPTKELGLRELKRATQALLLAPDFAQRPSAWLEFPAARLLNPLLSFLCSPRDLLKWRAVTALGLAVSRMAESDLESARVVMRRLMWTLCDESGGIGWGVPETMAESMALSQRLAAEFSDILIGYIEEDGNCWGNDTLVLGAVWGVGRLAQVRPQLLTGAVPGLERFLGSLEASFRGTACWALRRIGAPLPQPLADALLADDAELALYVDGELGIRRVCDLARG